MPSFFIALAGLSLGVVPQDAAKSAVSAAPPELPPVVVPDLAPEIRASDLESHVVFLAADALRGRPTGSPEVRRAAEYVAAVLEHAGLTPAGDGKGFLQEVPLVSFEHRALPRFRTWLPSAEIEEARPGAQFDVSIQGEPRSTGMLSIQIARTEAEIPATALQDQALLLEASSSDARAWLKDRKMDEGRGWGLIVLAGNEAERDREPKLPRPQRPHLVAEGPDAPDWVTVHGALRAALFAGERAFVGLEYSLDEHRVGDANVLARIAAAPGSPVGDQAIVLSAHIDHIGEIPERSREPGAEDFIFNGADDDASGVACLLELAAALATQPPPPRTLVFLFATGEEVGLWGTDYYLAHPVVPLERTVLNLNFEMLGRPDPLVGSSGVTWLTGFERSNLGPMFHDHGLEILADPHPEQHFFERSDNIAFVQRGIVGQTVSSYNLHTDYHKVSDEADLLDYEHMERGARTALQAVNLLAAKDFVPTWAPGEPDLGRR
jgi:hypothetical protein